MLSYQLQLHSRLTPQLQQTLSSAASSGSGQTGTSALGVGVQLVSALAPVPAGSQQQQPQQSSTPALDLAFLMLRGLLSALCSLFQALTSSCLASL